MSMQGSTEVLTCDTISVSKIKKKKKFHSNKINVFLLSIIDKLHTQLVTINTLKASPLNILRRRFGATSTR